MRHALPFLLTLATLSLSVGCSDPVSPERTADPPPTEEVGLWGELSFELVDQFGATHRSADLAGEVVLIDFWATWCGPCRISMPKIQEYYDTYASQGLRVLGVSIDQRDDIVQQYMARYGHTFPVARDATSTLTAHFEVTAVPHLFLIDRRGDVAFSHLGADVEPIHAQIQALLAE